MNELLYFFKQVLVMSVSASLIILFIKAAKWILKGRLSPSWHYYIWVLVLVRLIIPVTLCCKVSIFNIIPADIRTVLFQDTEEIALELDSSDYINAGSNKAGKTVNEFYPESLHKNMQSIQHDPGTELSADEYSKKSLIKSIYLNAYENINGLILFFYIWIFGIIISLFMLVGGIVVFKKRIKAFPVEKKYSVYQAFENTCDETGWGKNINLYYTRMDISPCMTGIFKRKIIIPYKLINMRHEELRQVFIHELNHARYRDNVIKLLWRIARTIHWFNPLVWMVEARISEEAEKACDERVLKHIGENKKVEYARLLLEIIRRFNVRVKTTDGWYLSGNRGIKNRIKEIADFKNNKSYVTIAGFLIVAVAVFFLMTNPLNDNLKAKNESGPVIDRQTEVNEAKNSTGHENIGNNYANIEKKDNDILEKETKKMAEANKNKDSYKAKGFAEEISQMEEYVLKDSDKRKVDAGEIMELNKEKLALARNEIYARKGHIFNKSEYIKYFNTKSWYLPLKTIVYNDLDYYERFNVNFILHMEKVQFTGLDRRTGFDTYPKDKEISMDINGDKKDEIISYSYGNGKYTLKVNDKKVRKDYIAPMEYFSIIDIDKTDKFMEIVVSDLGPSSDLTSDFYIYNGENLLLVGETQGAYDYGLKADGTGILSAQTRCSILQTWFYRKNYRIDNSHILKEINEKTYETLYRVFILEPLEVYEFYDGRGKRFIMSEGQTACLTQTDDSKWIKIEDSMGGYGWFAVDNFNEINGRKAEEYFSILCNAD